MKIRYIIKKMENIVVFKHCFENVGSVDMYVGIVGVFCIINVYLNVFIGIDIFFCI